MLVPHRILRRVIRYDLGLRLFGGAVTHQTAYPIAGVVLAGVADRGELGLPPEAPWPATVYLIEWPDPEALAGSSDAALLTVTWRRLYRARVRHAVLGALAGDACRVEARVAALGRTECDEARSVLRKDGALPAEASDAEVVAAFAASFLELSTFAPALRRVTFPAVEAPEEALAVFSADVDPAAVLEATRPAGAPDPAPWEPEGSEDPALKGPETAAESAADAEVGAWADAAWDRGGARSLPARAKGFAESGNNVRAARLWWRVAGTTGEAADEARAAARAQLKHLADRLCKALFGRTADAEHWADALAPLLRHAARGFWTPEARLLYDLQNVCLDHEKPVYRLEPLRWLATFGRRPLLRPLPHLREVTMAHHLRRAERRLTRVRLAREERLALHGLLQAAVHHAHDDLRARLRPRVDEALAGAWVRPRGVAERVAYRKLVEELLDKVEARGFATLGDLRDAASHSNLKMPDLDGPAEFLRGDRLLAADRALSERLDGVHRRGEVYLRWLQRFSALAFGTAVGRFVTLFIALPFGGAFVALKGLEEVDELVTSHLTGIHLHLVNPWSILLLGLVALGWINFPRFREGLRRAALRLALVLRGVFVDLPSWVVNNPVLHRLLLSAGFQLAWRLALKPLLAALTFGGVAYVAGHSARAAEGVGLAAFLVALFVVNTRAGRELEEVFSEELGRSLRVVTFDVIPGLFRLILAAFEDVLDWVEKVIYAVDEWLRFRGGQSSVMLAVKAVLGSAWAVAAYLIRVYVNVLIEPQINPIKHFPVVTVSAKVILPLSFKLTALLGAVLTPFLGKELGTLVAATNVILLPGVFGFLVWELKSNWRLYEANRPRVLGPVVVGSHGETFVGLLQPGFHSGTVPKQFARLRRARRAGRERSALKRGDALHHVEEAVRRFVERDINALLAETRALGGAGIRAGSIRLATNRVRIEVAAAALDGPPVTIDLEERRGVLAAGVSQPGWLDALDDDGRRAFNAALLGMAKLSGAARVQRPGAPIDPPPARALRLADVPLPWADWARGWDDEAAADDDGMRPRAFRPWPSVLPEGSPPARPGGSRNPSRAGC